MLARAAALVAARASALAPANAARAFAAAAHEFKLPDAPLVLSSTSGSIATLTWQIACKENALEKVQDELAQVGGRARNGSVGVWRRCFAPGARPRPRLWRPH